MIPRKLFTGGRLLLVTVLLNTVLPEGYAETFAPPKHKELPVVSDTERQMANEQYAVLKTEDGRSLYGVGESVQMICNYTNDVLFYSDNEDVVLVTKTGMTEMISPGCAYITAVSGGKEIAGFEIEVKRAPDSLDLYVGRRKLCVGMQAYIHVGYQNGCYCGYTISSSNPAVISLNGNIATAHSLGQATISVKTANGLHEATVLSVVDGSVGFFIEAPAEISVGEVRNVQISPSVENDHVCRSSDNDIISITQDGQFTGLKEGISTITVVSATGERDSMEIAVVPWYQKHQLMIIGHKGAAGHYAENTMISFYYAKELGADHVELDVRKTKDGRLVVIHDARISTDEDVFYISGLTYAQLKKIKPDICTLEEAITTIDAIEADIVIEVKAANIEEKVVECVGDRGLSGRVTYTSFDIDILKKLHKLDPDAELWYNVNKRTELYEIIDDPEDYAFVDAISVKYQLLTDNGIAELHRDGFSVIAWTVDDTELIEKYWKMGVDGVISDYPDRVRQLIS